MLMLNLCSTLNRCNGRLIRVRYTLDTCWPITRNLSSFTPTCCYFRHISEIGEYT